MSFELERQFISIMKDDLQLTPKGTCSHTTFCCSSGSRSVLTHEQLTSTLTGYRRLEDGVGHAGMHEVQPEQGASYSIQHKEIQNTIQYTVSTQLLDNTIAQAYNFTCR